MEVTIWSPHGNGMFLGDLKGVRGDMTKLFCEAASGVTTNKGVKVKLFEK